MDKTELDTLIMHARAGERLAESVEDLAEDVSEMKPIVIDLKRWLDNEQRIAQEAARKGPFAWIGALFEDTRLRVVITAILAAAATALTNYGMSRMGVAPPANQPPSVEKSEEVTDQEGG